MYNLTDSQKNIAKWLVQSVREGNLNEEFYIHWYPFRRGFPLVKLSNYKGTPESLENITQASVNVLAENQLLIYKVIQLRQDLSFKPFKPPLEEIWDCTLTGRIYTAVDTNFNSQEVPTTKYKHNPWASGSFYLVALFLVSTLFAIITAYIHWYALPVFVAVIMAIGIIGALQLRNDGELNEANFLTLMLETYRRLPLLIQAKSKPPSEE